MTALDANFIGHEVLHAAVLDCPKYGNDIAEADEMAVRVHDHISYTQP